MSVTSFNPQNNNSGAGFSKDCACVDSIVSVENLCWDDEKFNICGKSANVFVSARLNEKDVKVGDSRIYVSFAPIFTPQNVATDVTSWEYNDVLGNYHSGTGFFNNDMYDLIGTEENDLTALGYNITKITESTVTGKIKRIKIFGSLTTAEIDTLQGTFLILKKVAPAINGQYNSNEICFYKKAISNIIQGNGFVSFDFDLNYTSSVNAFQYWIEQTVYKINQGWFASNNQQYEQIIRVNRVPNDSEILITRTISFADTCTPRIIKKKVRVKKAKYPFVKGTGSAVTEPIILSIINIP